MRILLENENPQEIFESLNSTGLDLSNADLIRNYLLMALDYESQERLYKEYWLKMELLLKSSEAVENFLKNMHYYATIYQRFIFSESTDFKSLSPLEKKF